MLRGRGRTDKNAARWCEQMTASYNDLASSKPVFSELLNCVDLGVVAALIESRQLADRAGLDLSLLIDASFVQLSKYQIPTHVPTVAHGMKAWKSMGFKCFRWSSISALGFSRRGC